MQSKGKRRGQTRAAPVIPDVTASQSPKASNTGILDAEQTLKMLALPDTEHPPTPDRQGLEALHHATFLQLPLGVGYASRDGSFIWCNDAFDRMLGLEAGEHRNKSIRELTHASDQEHNDQMLCDLWEGRIKSYALEKRYVKRDGTELWVRVTAAMVRTPDGVPVSSVGFLEDISARKGMEAKIESVQKALMDASRQAGMAESPPTCCTMSATSSTA
jgi:PAS domain S-box-containing protein